ncbi:hypothetical protein KY084_03185 [Stakelama sp. CBK3Z-3]|uniref:ParB/Sulfiredoxin domain-containing protein n=1 Tax=Stakelama flava TaxID=2860338 RepID=A0ABS6XI70_9SPHN|nr:hypothetical protein [Stakelama flava]MBW4329877.1 hypothetical protein [Stakelama flava]
MMSTKSNPLPFDDEPNAHVPEMPESETGVLNDAEPIEDGLQVHTDSDANDKVAENLADFETGNNHADHVEDAEDHNCTEEFRPAATVPGEFLVPIREIGEWEYHLRRFSPVRASHASALALSASDPRSLRPIVVLEKHGKYLVVDGRFMLGAIKAQHPGDDDVMVRVVLFSGDEGEAVAAMCDGALGTAVATKMEMAHGLLALQRANRISQTALAERYGALTKDKVSQMLIAARLQEAYPVLFQVLEEPHKAPISLAVALNKAVKAMTQADFVDLLARAAACVEDGERCGPGDLFDLLDIPHQRVTKADGSDNMITLEADDAAEAIFGHDDQQVGSAEQLADGAERLTLPSATVVGGMNHNEREAAAEGFITHIRRYFGLGAPV